MASVIGQYHVHGAGFAGPYVELDAKIEQFERLASTLSDQLTIQRLKEAVEQMKTQKAALHAKQT